MHIKHLSGILFVLVLGLTVPLFFAHTGLSCPLRTEDSWYPVDSGTAELDTIPALDLKVDEYTFILSFDFDNSTYSGSAVIDLINVDQGAPNPVELDASSALLTINSVMTAEWENLEFTHENDILAIEIPFDFWDTLQVIVDYSGEEGQVNGPFGGMGVWMTNDRAWSFSFPDGAHAWAPVIDNPNCKALVNWQIGVPEGLTAVANGSLTATWNADNEDWFRWEGSHPACTSEMGFAIADYEVIEAQADPFPIRYYVYPNDYNDALFDFARIPEAVGVFENAFGFDYPFDELKIVECGVFGGFGGQEHQTMVSLGNGLITGNRQYESIVVHEIAHQWFADLVTPVHWEHFWLNEGFAVWSEAVWADHLQGWSGYLNKIQSDRSQYFNWEQQGHNQALVNTDYDVTMSSPLPYERGALAVHQLRMRYGEEDFSAALQDYLESNAYGYVCSEDLRDFFQIQTGDPETSDWFNQWVWRGEAPLIHWAVGGPDDSVVYLRQMLNEYNSPDNGELYDRMRVTYGSHDNKQALDWPEGAETVTWTLDPWTPEPPANPTLFPDLEVPARLVYRDDLTTPLPRVRIHLDNESELADNVLEQGETAQIRFYLSNPGLGLDNASWTILPDDEGVVEWAQTEGDLPELSFLQPEELELEIEVTGNGGVSPAYADFDFQITAPGYETTVPLRISMGRPEILLLEDGVAGAVDTIAAVLEDYGIVWGTPNEPLADLPENMYGADAVMIEADGRYADYLFSGDDTALLDWFAFDGSGMICGEYLHLIYSDAQPAWSAAVPGEWNEIVTGPAFFGMVDDPIADGRNILAYGQLGTTNCTPCCGNPAVFLSIDNTEVGARLDAGWRIAAYGFSLSKLSDTAPATMTRDELIQRTAYYITYRDLAVDEGDDLAIPEKFSFGAYPNPFNSTLRIRLNLPAGGWVTLDVYNLLGRKVAEIANRRMEAGQIILTWKTDGLASGTYIISANFAVENLTRRVLLVR